MRKYEKPTAVITEYRVKKDIALQEYYYLKDNKKVSLFNVQATSTGA